jgi:diguanylate cyclase (GGDEF)-like protein/PAS domain S-box-containing protein
MNSFVASHPMTASMPQIHLNSEQQAVFRLNDGQIIGFNEAASRLFGASHQQLAQKTHPAELSPLVQPCGSNSYEKAEQMLTHAIQQRQHQFHWLHQRLNGETFYARVTLIAETESDKAAVVAMVQDLTPEVLTSLDAALGRLMFSKSHDALMITDRHNLILDVNAAFCQITGYQRAEVIGLPAGFMRSGKHDQEFYSNLWQHLKQYGSWEGEIWDKHRQGHLFLKDLKICTVLDPEGHVMNYLALFSDTSEKANHKRELEKLAYYDTLTGLPNRALLLERLERTLSELQPHHNDQQLALAFIDIDNFKTINDTRGHVFGDQLIKALSQRLANQLSSDDFLGRISGDEFLLIFSPQQQLEHIEQQSRQFVELLRKPFTLGDISQSISVSIGVSHYPQDGNDSKSLIATADIAMYHAKKLGGNQLCFYTAELGADFFEKSNIELHLADAIRKNNIYPKFQPKIDLHQGKVTGGEILARWQRPTGEFVPPDKFITVAEQQNLIQDLSLSLIRQCGLCSSNLQEPLPATLAFNVSVQELLRPEFSQQFINSLKHHGLPVQHCEIEITESCLIGNFELAKSSISELRQHGIKVAIDDFGTGFCSLNYLRSLSVDTIKLDRSFVGELDYHNRNNLIVVKSIIDLAHLLGIKVLAEGVETQTQLVILKALQCDEVQGFYFSPALEWSDFYQFARQYCAEDINSLDRTELNRHLATLLKPHLQ